MTLIYPHRLTFLDRKKCDVCGNQGKNVVYMTTDHYFGWETCNKDECNQIIKDWYDKITITKEELIENYGDFVYIKRSSGKMESSWEIHNNARQEEINGPYWLKVKHKTKHQYKEIKLSDLQQWNNK
jgi:hypothetical protein